MKSLFFLRKKTWIALMLALVVLLTGCGAVIHIDDHINEKPVIVCTLFPQYDFARQIYGNQAEVVMLLPPGTESHTFDPTPQDMVTIVNADLFIYTGDEMEPWAAEIVASLDHTQVLDLSQYVQLQEEQEHEHEDEEEADIHEHHHHEHSYDPHYWLNLQNAAQMVETIGNQAELLGINKEEVQVQVETYKQQLLDMDTAFETLVRESDHDTIVFAGRFAYGYFISRYGLNYESVYDGCSAEADPSIYDMIHVIDYINDHQVSLVLYEELSNKRVAESIAEDTHVDLAQFSTGHNVTKEEFDQGITFLDIMEQNYSVLDRALNTPL